MWIRCSLVCQVLNFWLYSAENEPNVPNFKVHQNLVSSIGCQKTLRKVQEIGVNWLFSVIITLGLYGPYENFNLIGYCLYPEKKYKKVQTQNSESIFDEMIRKCLKIKTENLFHRFGACLANILNTKLSPTDTLRKIFRRKLPKSGF